MMRLPRPRTIAWGGLALLATTALFAPFLGLRDPTEQNAPRLLRERPPLTRVVSVAGPEGIQFFQDSREAPEGAHIQQEIFWLGTDRFGRDLLSRLVYGARASLFVGLLAAALALTVGALVGGFAGLFGGIVDSLLMRFTDLTLTVPRLFLAMLLVALYGPGAWTTILVLGGTSWMTAARLVRGEMLRQSSAPYVHAARAAGLPQWRIGLRHLFPAALSVLGVEAALRVGETILLEATLSFLELGIQEPTPSWGNLIRSGQASLPHAWWIALFPGLLIAVTVICCACLAETSRTAHER